MTDGCDPEERVLGTLREWDEFVFAAHSDRGVVSEAAGHYQLQVEQLAELVLELSRSTNDLPRRILEDIRNGVRAAQTDMGVKTGGVGHD